MRHRIKKIPTLSKLTSHHLLHSDKSTYFYKGKIGKLFDSIGKIRLAATSPKKPSAASRARKRWLAPVTNLVGAERREKQFFSSEATPENLLEEKTGRKNTVFRGEVELKRIVDAIPLSLSSIALLLVLGLILFPRLSNEVMAITDESGTSNDDGMTLSLSLSAETIGSNSDGSAPAVIGKPSFGGVQVEATAQGINTSTGYSIYVQAANGSSRNLVNNIDASNMIEPITAENGITGTSIPENQWGYALEKGANLSRPAMTYKPVSATGQTVPAAYTGNEELDSEVFTLAFGANIGEGKLPGHYTTNVLVSLVAEAKAVVTYELIYDGNGNTGGSVPTTDSMTNREDSHTFTVAGNTGNLEKTNHEFLGWADAPDATAAQYTDGSPITLSRIEGQETISKTIYAVWKQTIVLPDIEGTITQKFGNFTYMQEPGLKDYCTSNSTPDKTSGQLVDGRDGKIYWVTKLAGTCWMTQDLDLDLGPNGPDLTTANDGDNLYKGSATSWDGSKNVASSSSGWATNVYNVANWWGRDTLHGIEHTSLGNLYSYEAATAGTGHTVTSDGGEVSGSICPSGWKLPVSGGASVNYGIGSFQSLLNAGMTSNTATNKAPYYFQYGGTINGSLSGIGDRGRYWSAISNSSNYAYALGFNTDGNFNTASNYARHTGYSVRCVVR